MKDILAIVTIMIWPVVPLFWIPVHCLSKVFKRLGVFTYIMPMVTWPPIAYIIYLNRDLLLQFKIQMPFIVHLIGFVLLILGGILQIWTGLLLGILGLMGLPEVSKKVEGRLITEGPFSIVRHPTYLAHTLMFSGVFFITEVLAVGVITILDMLIINFLVIPLEEKELIERFGEQYRDYMKRVRSRFLPLKKFF
jgi:protein-S-isoprenylcysteine O-methyltransferase Ste14